MIYYIAQQILDPNDVDLPNKDVANINENIANGLKIVFGVAGGVAFLIITLAGLKYVLSQGNPQETAKAKNTIIDALIGLIISLAAFAIVAFLTREVA